MSNMEFANGKILASIADGVGRVVFNQPEKRNAMSVDMWGGMGEALDLFAEDPGVRCVVLQGAGDKAFVSGADISQFEKARSNADAQQEYDRITGAGRIKLANYPKPVIAQIRGFCMGGGLGIAMATDIRIASDDSQFGIPAARLGIAYNFDMVRALVDLVGPAQAHLILMTGDRFPAAEAERFGLVNKVVPVAELEATVAKLAATMAANAPLSLKTNKQTVKAVLRDPADRDLDAIRAAMAACFDSADYREGRRAFMEKRKPAFTGS
ncbi:enoyl-CoA hydratase [Siccirubricoccus deserti]|jgi:enoyl-CoA hydratase/carnithine racemase|uniref:Enoyl-CoA hydratase/isomerase family protein n=2 Tax=Siccirubricoccus deserti TaxID=2013562 RepID=A0A9X0QXX8_9PROT|nr:enoyl-CoA hydratase/isomerase family protein [Siccirubricoccus deserti]GGC34128.1 enoyl-CoA hydratase [Siccirubricoccus deserti]